MNPLVFDIKNQIDIAELARKMVEKENKAVIMVVHDLNMAMLFRSDHFIKIRRGRSSRPTKISFKSWEKHKRGVWR